MRVKKKGFIVTTLLFPLIMVVLMMLPTLLQNVGTSKPDVVTVVDPSGLIGEELTRISDYNYDIVTDPGNRDSILSRSAYHPVIIIDPNILTSEASAPVSMYSKDTPGIEVVQAITNDINKAVESIRLRHLGYDNIDSIMEKAKADVSMLTLKVDDKGNVENANSLSGMLIGILMSFILYMFLLIYGQSVMQSIIEEKNNRVLELIVTTVRPTHLMLGKIVGVGAVALTQVVIWGLIIGAFVKFGLPAMVDLTTIDPNSQMAQVYFIITQLSYIASIFGWLMVYLIGGFMLYASIYAAIGASVDNSQDGSQLQIFATFPIIISFVFSMSIGTDPNSSLATWLSIIPLTSPMAMMCRIPSGVPMWELILSVILLIATIVLAIWLAAKIYRVGIFMHGRKPTVRDLIRWARYK